MTKKSNVLPFKTCKELWISWMQMEIQRFEDPNLIDLHTKVMMREQERNLKTVDFFYTIEYLCSEDRFENVKHQFNDTIKLLFSEIARTSKPYIPRKFKDLNKDLKGRLQYGGKNGTYTLHIGLESLIFLENIISTLLCNADMYERMFGIKVLSITKKSEWPGT